MPEQCEDLNGIKKEICEVKTLIKVTNLKPGVKFYNTYSVDDWDQVLSIKANRELVKLVVNTEGMNCDVHQEQGAFRCDFNLIENALLYSIPDQPDKVRIVYLNMQRDFQKFDIKRMGFTTTEYDKSKAGDEKYARTIDYQKVVSVDDLTDELSKLVDSAEEIINRRDSTIQWHKQNLRKLAEGLEKTRNETSLEM